MAILRKSALALAAMFCLGVAVPVLAQGRADKSTADVNAAQNTVKEMQMLGESIKARQANAQTGVTPVAAPVVRRADTADAGTKVPGKKAGKKGGKKKKTS